MANASTHRLCDHGGCQTPAVVTLTACYPLENEPHQHPRWGSYPAPMFKACRNHVAVLCEMDAGAPGSTTAWIVRPLYVTKSGKILSDADIEALADEAEEGYDPSELAVRKR